MGKRDVLWYVFVGSRGGETRICIMDSISDRPKNPRKLALELQIDYSTVRHGLRVLEKNRLVFAEQKKYGAKYMPSPEFETMRGEYEELKKHRACTKGT